VTSEPRDHPFKHHCWEAEGTERARGSTSWLHWDRQADQDENAMLVRVEGVPRHRSYWEITLVFPNLTQSGFSGSLLME
jgi:hypothetical protein